MARQEDTCWRCGTRWASEEAPPTTLQVIAGGLSTPVSGVSQPAIAPAVAGNARGRS
jgi:hypothetical protein